MKSNSTKNQMDKEFDKLQHRLQKQHWIAQTKVTKERTIVYIAGMSLDHEELAKITGIEFYEERLLFAIGLLRNKKTTIIFVSSKQIDPLILDYYFKLFSRSEAERLSMKKRWFHFYIGNNRTNRTLTQKILQSERVLKQIESKLGNKNTAVLRCFNSSVDEKALAVKLGIPLFAPDPEFLYLGSKSGARALFKSCKLKPPFGYENINTIELLIEKIKLIKKRRKCGSVVLKFDYSFSGVGNAILPVKKFPKSPKAAERYIKDHVVPCESGVSRSQYLNKLFKSGGIVEEWIDGEKKYSPSVQIAIEANKKVRILSSHEQLLDEETNQVYLGARFPARRSIRSEIILQAKVIGKALANSGVIGPLGIDFLVVKRQGRVYTHPVEINLRKGGTTHPFQIARLLTAGLSKTEGTLRSNKKKKVHYYSFDNIKSKDYIGMTPKLLLTIIQESGLAFDPENNIGVVIHIMGALRKHGKFGVVCIARSPLAAEQLFILLKRVLDIKCQSDTKAASTEEVVVNKKRLVNTFLELARISSPSGQEGDIRLLLREEFVRLGLKTRVDKVGNLIGKKPGKGKVPLLLACHMDTVKPCANVKPVVRGNVIMTDGNTILGADNKAGLTYVLEMLQILQEHNLEHRPLEIVFSVQEEVFSIGVQNLDLSKIKSPFGIVIDGAALGEVDYTAPYIATVNVTITGKSAHSGVEPEKGISAIQIASHAIQAMKLGRLQADTTANIGVMSGGTNRNAIPDNVQLHGEVRSLSKLKLEEQLERMHKALEDAAEKFGGLLNIDSKVAVPGYTFPKSDKDIQHIMKVMKQVGIKPRLRQAGGASDANIFVSKGVKTIDVGTGVKKPHTVEESIAVADMVTMTEFILEMVRV